LEQRNDPDLAGSSYPASEAMIDSSAEYLKQGGASLFDASDECIVKDPLGDITHAGDGSCAGIVMQLGKASASIGRS
jgi:hypothetical protein